MKTLTLRGARIEAAMKARKMTPDDLAYEIRRLSGGAIRTTTRSVLNWIQGVNVPRGDVIPLIAQATRQPIDFFYGNDDDTEGSAADEEPG
jgi:hypothetical protein